MNKQIFTNRWFVWAIVCLIVAGIGLWGYLQYALIEMDIESSESHISFTLTLYKRGFSFSVEETGT